MHYTIYHLVTLSNTMRPNAYASILSAHTTRTQAVAALRAHNRQRRQLGTTQVYIGGFGDGYIMKKIKQVPMIDGKTLKKIAKNSIYGALRPTDPGYPFTPEQNEAARRIIDTILAEKEKS
jgi:hypothetical protein